MNNKIASDQIFAFFATTALCSIVLLMRRPDLLTNPQFWAEDGKIWIEQAYNIGPLRSLILPQNGYYQTISRLAALASLATPFYFGPLLFNMIAVLLRSFLIAFILSPRLGRYPLPGRILLSIFILLMPHISEVHANITNTHWYLSIWLFMILVSEPSEGKYWHIHDYLVLVVAGLSGPFIVLLAPVMVLRMLDGRIFDQPMTLIRRFARGITPFSATFFIVALAQVLAILRTGSDGRSHAPLGANFMLLCDIVSTRIFAGFLLPSSLLNSMWEMHLLNIVVALACFTTLMWVVVKGEWREKSFVIFAALVLGSSLSRPMLSLDSAQWPLMKDSGERYLLIPHIFWMAIILTIINKFAGPVKKNLFYLLFGLVLLSGIYNFRLPPLPDSHWIKEAYKYEQARPGETVELQINPPGWTMLIKKPDPH